jgi:hypothetical protein
MTSDERAQLIEDIKKSTSIRADIVERASMSEDFDIAAAWENLTELDESITLRVMASRQEG